MRRRWRFGMDDLLPIVVCKDLKVEALELVTLHGGMDAAGVAVSCGIVRTRDAMRNSLRTSLFTRIRAEAVAALGGGEFGYSDVCVRGDEVVVVFERERGLWDAVFSTSELVS